MPGRHCYEGDRDEKDTDLSLKELTVGKIEDYYSHSVRLLEFVDLFSVLTIWDRF